MKIGLGLTACGIFVAMNAQTAGAVLVAHYTFDDSSEFTSGGGDTISDVSGNGRDATESPNNVLWDSNGISGGAINARANNASLLTPVLPNGLVKATEYTLTFWVNSNNNPGFLDWGEVNFSDGNEAQLRTLNNPNPGLYYRDIEPADPDWLSVNRNVDVLDGEWHHMAVVVDPITNNVTTYIDGGNPQGSEELGSGSPILNPRTSTDYIEDIQIGRSFSMAGPTGLIDDVQLYNIALTSEEVAFLYNNPGQAIPEPSSLALLGLGGLLIARRRR